MDTKTKGIISELKVASRLIELGYTVFAPIGGYGPCDLIRVDSLGKITKGQIKTARYVEKDSIEFSTKESGRDRGKTITRSGMYDEVVDVFWVYCPYTDKCYEMSVDGLRRTSVKLFLGEERYATRRYAKDFMI